MRAVAGAERLEKPMATTDRYDLPLSTDSQAAAEAYIHGVDAMLSAWPDAGDAFDRALAADPDFALAQAAQARVLAMRSQPAEARARIALARDTAARRGTERERSHVDVVWLMMNGQSAKALERALAHADRWPRDVSILSLPLGAFGLFAFSGMADHDQARVDLCGRHAGAFGPDDWWFLTSHGWSLAENGEVARGREMLHRAMEIRRPNANGIHALAHAMFEGGAGADASALIADWLPDYDPSGVLHGHIAWHAALVALESGDAGGAYETYLRYVHPSVSQGMPINIVSDAASLLWRMEAYGHGAPAAAWSDVETYARQAFPRAGHAFLDPHMAMIEAASGDHSALERRIAALEDLVAQGALAAGSVVPTIVRAAAAFAAGNYAACADLLEPAAHDVVRIGGSGAQREIVEDTLLVALIRSDRADKARTLLDSRLHRRPSPRDAQWRANLGV